MGVALWRQIADEIRRGIVSGLADADGRLPPESRLAERFGVNRHTVRAAIAALAHEGVLQTAQGRGTYVRQRKRFVYPIGRRTRFSAGLHDQAGATSSTMLETATETARPAVAAALGLLPGASVIRIESLGTADGVPVSRATSWFDGARFSGIADLFARTGSITAALAGCGVTDYRRASTGIEARHADEADTRELHLSAGAIVIVTQALNVDLSERPIQFSTTRFSADRVELIVSSTGLHDAEPQG